ncbi:MAG: V-type ATP synthase subunit A [Candidatus Brocadiaceae bacterium]|nr:V-type ATP synthase subunit A [Candidatus Brocadiaceae bacterium]
MAEQAAQESQERAPGRVMRVSGPLVVAEGLSGTKMYELVRIGEARLFGEVIEIRGDAYSIQVYEETEGVGPGEPVFPMGNPLSVELGPGLIESIYDGVQRPLRVLAEKYGDYIVRGADAPALDRKKRWSFVPTVKEGDQVGPGDIIGTVRETPVVEHRVMVPPGVRGRVRSIKACEATVTDPVAVLESDGGEVPVTMMQVWPVRTGRPVARKHPPVVPLVTGQRVLDMLYPVAMGGTACIPGPFGSGKTVVQHQLAKWSNADIIVYLGCGERGNEMTDVLLEFPELHDPRSGEPLMRRTVLVANTSNMPVAAREASVFTGITMAEYFRDMGYNVALMADSTSRWAEAMREVSGRLEEMPGEEGYPAYLAGRIAAFYERVGFVDCQGAPDRQGTLTVIGAVSPPGGDLSEPVVQSTLRVVKVFWSLEASLAAARHFPAISWLRSYSLYQQAIDAWANEHVAPGWEANRKEAMRILQRESELEELVRLVGIDALSMADRLLMEAARMIREDFLHQNAFDDIDTYTSLPKQFRLLALILRYHERARNALEDGADLDSLTELPVIEGIARAKRIAEDELDRFDALMTQVDKEINALTGAGGEPGKPSDDEEGQEE